MPRVTEINRHDVDATLLKVEQGKSDKDDANLLRAYLQQLESAIYGLYGVKQDELLSEFVLRANTQRCEDCGNPMDSICPECERV